MYITIIKNVSVASFPGSPLEPGNEANVSDHPTWVIVVGVGIYRFHFSWALGIGLMHAE